METGHPRQDMSVLSEAQWSEQIATLQSAVIRYTAAGVVSSGSSRAALDSSHDVRVRVLALRRGRLTVTDGLAHLHCAASGLSESRAVLARMRGALVVTADHSGAVADRGAQVQRFLRRCLQELEGGAELARSRALGLLAGSATPWSGAGAVACAGSAPAQGVTAGIRPALSQPVDGSSADGVLPVQLSEPILPRLHAADELLAAESARLVDVEEELHRRCAYPQPDPDDGGRTAATRADPLAAATLMGARAVVLATEAHFRAVRAVRGPRSLQGWPAAGPLPWLLVS